MGKCQICGKETESYKHICDGCAEGEVKPYGRYCVECGVDMFEEDHKEGCEYA